MIRVEQFRRGQLAAFNCIRDRIEKRQTYTSVVLPTRYGKTWVILVTGLSLIKDGLVPCVLAISPGLTLRDQMVDPTKFNEALTRFNIDPTGIRYRAVGGKSGTASSPEELNLNKNGEQVLSLTIQFVQMNLRAVCAWVQRIAMKTGLSPLIFIDESHTGSEKNEWGRVYKALADAGARLVLLTATPFRADLDRIPGFLYDEVDTKQFLSIVCRKGSTDQTRLMEVFDSQKQTLMLKADYELGFKQAWEEDVLCHVSRYPFDVDMTKFERMQVSQLKLSQASPAKARQLIGKVVRDEQVVATGVKQLLQSMEAYRKVNPTISSIIFSADDLDGGTNQHAQQIRTEILAQRPDLDVVIATSSDGGGAETLRRFRVDGKGDILIVKQMAGMGLDIPRLKVMLDLSPMRTATGLIQRLMRAATIFGPIRHCVYITPDDALSRGVFEVFVRQQGGEAVVKTRTLQQQYEQAKKDPQGKAIYMVDGTQAAAFQDTKGNLAAGSEQQMAEQLLAELPELTQTMSMAEMARQFGQGKLTVRADALDVRASIEMRKQLLSRVVRTFLMKKLKRTQKYTAGAFGLLSKDFWQVVYKSVDLPYSSLERIDDLKRLELIENAAKEVIAAEKR